MRVRVLGAAPGGGFPLTSVRIDDTLAVDAGALGHAAPPADLARVRHVLLTHPHIDHIAGLPVFLDTVYGLAPKPPAVWATAPTLAALQAHIFNGVLMPDFIGMAARMPPFLTLRELVPDKPAKVGGYRVTPLPLDHAVPTVGYVIDDGTAAVAVITDTAPVPAVFARLARWKRLRLVLLEASFPDSEGPLAKVSKHLTAGQHRELAASLPAGVRVRAMHVKPRWAAEIGAQVAVADGELVV